MRSRHAHLFKQAKAERDARDACKREGHVWAAKPRRVAGGSSMWIKSCRRCPAGIMHRVNGRTLRHS